MSYAVVVRPVDDDDARLAYPAFDEPIVTVLALLAQVRSRFPHGLVPAPENACTSRVLPIASAQQPPHSWTSGQSDIIA